MRVLKGIAFLVIALILLAALLLTLAFQVDYSRLKPRVETLLTDLLGRELRIAGDMRLDLDLNQGIYFQASDATLASTEWTVEPDMARLDTLEIRLAWQDLLQRPIPIREARVEGLAVFLEQDAEGRDNWSFDFGDDSDSTVDDDAPFELPVIPVVLQADNSSLIYRGPNLKQPLTLSLASLTERRAPDSSRKLEAKGLLNGTDLDIEIGVDASSNTISLTQMKMDWWATLGEITLRGNARIADLLAPRRPELNLRLQGPNIEYLTDLLNMQRLSTGALNLDISFEPRGDVMALEVDGVAGEFEVQADGYFGDIRKLEQAQLTLSASGPNAGHVANLLGLGDMAPDPFQLEATGSRSGTELTLESARLAIAGTTIEANASLPNFPEPEAAKLQLRLQGTELQDHAEFLGLPLKVAGPFQGQVDVWPAGNRSVDLTGWLSVDQLKVRLSGRGNLTSEEDFADSLLEWRLNVENMAEVADRLGIGSAPSLPLLASGRLAMSGNSILLEEGRAVVGTYSNALTGTATLPLAAEGSRIAASASGDSLGMLIPASPALEELDNPFKAELAVKFLANGILIETAELVSMDTNISVSGQLGEAPDYLGTGLDVDLALPELSRLDDLLEQELPDLPLDAEATISQSEDRLTFHKLRVSLGESDLRGKMYIVTGETPHIAARLNSDFVDLTPFLPPREETEVEDAPSSPRERRNRRVIPDTAIDIAALENFSADLVINAKTVKIEAQTVHDFVLESLVENGALLIPRVEIVAPRGGWMRGGMRVSPADGGVRLSGRLVGENMTIGLPAQNEEEVSQLPRYDLKMGFIGTGSTTRDVAAGLNAFLRIESGEGRIRAGALRLFTGDFASELLTQLNPFVKQDPYSDVRCVTLFTAVEQGQLEGKPAVVVQTDRLKILADANVDLETEKLSVYFQTTPQKGLGFSVSSLINPYIMVTGTLGNPLLTVDPEGTLIQGGAAIATGGLSILAKGFKDRFLSNKDPCGQAMLDADKRVQELEAKYAPNALTRGAR